MKERIERMTNDAKKIRYLVYVLLLVFFIVYTFIAGDPWNFHYLVRVFLLFGTASILIFVVYFLIVEMISRLLPYGKKKRIRRYMKPYGRKIRIHRKLFGKRSKMKYSLLYPADVIPEIPDEELIAEFDRRYGDILPADAVSFYTRDPDVLRYREKLFRELHSDKGLRNTLLSLAESLDCGEEESPVMILRRKKALIQSIRRLSDKLSEPYESEALTGLQKFIGRIISKPKFLTLENDVQAIPDGEIRSLTLAVNLNESFYPTEIGVVSVSNSICDRAEPLERNIDSSEEALNRAVLKAAEQVILQDLAKKRVKFRRILKAEFGIDKRFADEICYAIRMAEIA